MICGYIKQQFIIFFFTYIITFTYLLLKGFEEAVSLFHMIFWTDNMICLSIDESEAVNFTDFTDLVSSIIIVYI